MAEAILNSNSFVNKCTFCDKKLVNENELRSHLQEIHNISMNTIENRCEDDFEEVPKYYSTRTSKSRKKSPLGSKMKELKNVLKENFSLYLREMKLWINCDITRPEFYENVSSFFTPETIEIHNDFLLSFLREIRSISQMSKSNPSDSFHYAIVDPTSVEMPSRSHVIRNISKAIAMRRKCLKVKPNGLLYDTGKVDPKDVSPDDQPKYTGSVTLPELLEALEAHPELIPLKSIYNITIQTIMQSLERQKARAQEVSEHEDN